MRVFVGRGGSTCWCRRLLRTQGSDKPAALRHELEHAAPPSALFTGTVSMFAAAGFREIGRTYPSRPVMRHDLGS